ncbi:hypothetical protein FRX31_026137 [Thalictrum thalictroides]|uniref:Uncharacterized protein n=1 Tax=Thalictrum thalictroides TaxID=46969 RepID=A0A7J6VGN6_THATH|nr:hypothetical protein FRX31_026137 [Thalictrum thalictroides]
MLNFITGQSLILEQSPMFKRLSYLTYTQNVCKEHLFPFVVMTDDTENLKSSQKFLNNKTPTLTCILSGSSLSQPSSLTRALQTAVPLTASLCILFWSNPVNAGILSGYTGLESIPGPQLPQIDFLNKFNEENQKKYAEFDERIKNSPLLKKYLEQSELNKEKNKKAIQDKYCLRGAEIGVGDCSTEGMTVAERDDFIAMLKKKVDEK